MGQQPSKTTQGNKIQHDLFGLVQFMEVKNEKGNHQQRIKIKRQLNSAKMFTEWEKQIKYLMNDDARQIFYLPYKNRFSQQALCGSAGTLEIQCQYYKHVLKTQIVNRYHGKLRFQESQLWYLLYNLLEAAFYMQPSGLKIGDVHPCNIVINQKGRTKVVPSCLLPGQLNNYQKIVEQTVSDCFLAPQEIDEAFIQKGVYPKVNPCRAEVFSIGVTVLMAGTLTDCYYLYSRSPIQFCKEKKQDLMQDINKHYSKFLYHILGNMLQENPNNRRAASDLFRQLSRYQDDILSLRDFDQPTCNNEIYMSQPSIADFLTPVKGKTGSMVVNEEVRQTLDKMNNSIQ